MAAKVRSGCLPKQEIFPGGARGSRPEIAAGRQPPIPCAEQVRLVGLAGTSQDRERATMCCRRDPDSGRRPAREGGFFPRALNCIQLTHNSRLEARGAEPKPHIMLEILLRDLVPGLPVA